MTDSNRWQHSRWNFCLPRTVLYKRGNLHLLGPLSALPVMYLKPGLVHDHACPSMHSNAATSENVHLDQILLCIASLHDDHNDKSGNLS